MNKENLYVWACDYSEISGEGNLARLFTKRLSNHYNVIIKTPTLPRIGKIYYIFQSCLCSTSKYRANYNGFFQKGRYK